MIITISTTVTQVMAELGNTIVNTILEAKLEGAEKPAGDSMRAVREVWIGQKYRERKFVNKEVFEGGGGKGAEAWTVKRLRRRARRRKKEAEGSKEALAKEEKEVDTAEGEEGSILESVLRASTLGPVSRVLNAEECLFGGSLGKHAVANLELDSDQESTDGEGEGGGGGAAAADQLASLTPELLLYRAAAAHNLPVMCQAVALGADMEWR